AAMMAGHPNDSTPESLRNTAFTLHMGANDSAYNRNKVAAQWEKLLAGLQEKDPQGYTHLVKIHEGKGHWMDREDRVAVPWMAKHTRNPLPQRIVWKQDDVTHNRFYWLAVNNENRQGRTTTIVQRDGQTFNIERCDLQEIIIRLNDDLCNLNKPITVSYQGHNIFRGKVTRSSELIRQTILERGDYTSVFSAEITVTIPSK
ncbi:MAG TPA: polyhydroxyalkanoate depolymerase, partial [Planctomycetaceae bacterium]|nr:polyhydroxyalkanoate depolymerase [Planctomycetaceae bacterium]